jgi:outer membrane protein TolC
MSGPGEVYRWESQLASNRKAVVDAQALRNTAEIVLNRLLHRPIEEHFLTLEEGLDDYLGIIDDERLQEYMGNKWSFRNFRDFAVGEALALAPELRALDAALAAQRRALTSAGRAFWLPSLALQGELTTTLDESGAGADANLSSLFPPQMASGVPSSDDVNWNVAISASLPLFSGGARFARRSRAGYELDQLTLQREALAERIEQRVRSALHIAGASRAAVGFSASAAEAARKNLELVADAYSRGVVSILDLLDAQNAALVADLQAANAVFQFLIDFMEVQRAAGKFYSLAPQEEVDEVFNRLEKYFDEIAASEAGR